MTRLDLTAERIMEPAAQTPCQACPWRCDNQGKRNAGGWYTKANLQRLWAGLRRGVRMTCHPTDDRMNADPGMPRPVPPGTKLRECAGAQTLVQRELHRVQETLGSDRPWSSYAKEHPRGMTKEGAFGHLSNMAITWPGETPVTLMNLNTDEVAYEPLGPWEPVS